ncbi:hypothetical protein D3C72_1883430 [compost metagenome]
MELWLAYRDTNAGKLPGSEAYLGYFPLVLCFGKFAGRSAGGASPHLAAGETYTCTGRVYTGTTGPRCQKEDIPRYCCSPSGPLATMDKPE